MPFRLTGSSSTLHVEWDGEPILIPGIVGNAIRSLQYDAELSTLIILTAGQDGREPSAKAFAVWRWSGASHEPAVRLVDFGPRIGDREIAPAGICRVTLPGGDSYLLVVSDRAPFYWKFRVGRQP